MSEALIIDPPEPASSAIIWLHGLGADRSDFDPVARMLQKQLNQTRFVLPQAPSRPVTMNGGMTMPSWYDIRTLNHERDIDEQQMLESAQEIERLVEDQYQQGIPYERIVLAGFSQGGAVVLHTAYVLSKQRLAGVVLLSSYGPTLTPLNLSNAQKSTPLFCGHGTEDFVVPMVLGQNACETLKNQSVHVSWHTYTMGHELVLPEIKDIQNWLSDRL